MNNPLLSNLSTKADWFSSFSFINLILMVFCLLFVIYSFRRVSERFKRPSFILALFVIILYQIPLVLFSSVIYQNLSSAFMFALSIHAVVICNFLWVYLTPKLNASVIENKQSGYSAMYFRGFIFWFPVLIFFALLGIYLYKIPFTCSAFYSLFMDQEISLLVREVIGKLLGRSYVPHILNIITSGVGPIVAFLLIGRIYYDFNARKYLILPVWLILLIAVLLTPLLGGAKGSLVPMAVSLSVIAFILARNWKFKILFTGGIVLTFALMILVVKVTQESGRGMGGYQFGHCIAKLNACARTKVLLESLRPPKAYYGVSRQRLDALGDDLVTYCHSNPIEYSDFNYQNNVKPGIPKTTSIQEHIIGIFYRVFVNPIQVASWHFLYVDENGSPSFYGLSIVKLFSEKYISIPAKVCELYYLGDKTSACTAPTSYLFTYPSYLGYFGLLLACFLSLCFDLMFSILIKQSPLPLAHLALGIVTIGSVNLIAADYLTVLISHGVGVAYIVLATMSWYSLRMNKHR